MPEVSAADKRRYRSVSASIRSFILVCLAVLGGSIVIVAFLCGFAPLRLFP
jgi:hypothetical protein